MYLFCGKPRKADIKECLQQLSKTHKFHLTIREVDIERNAMDDLSSVSLWNEIFAEVRAGKWDCAILSPPCNTWSRARYQWRSHPGPRPLRSLTWPWGFPWLDDKSTSTVKEANLFVINSINLARAIADVGGHYLFEHPEDLGRVAGESPASIWQLDEMRQLQVDTRATTWAIFQCAFNADSPKPTRFLSNLKRCTTLKCKTWPQFDSARRYLGPLPFGCGHKFHVKKLIGKTKAGTWTTSPSAAYPPALCKYLASLIASAARCRGDDRSVVSVGSSGAIHLEETWEVPEPATATPGSVEVGGDLVTESNIDAVQDSKFSKSGEGLFTNKSYGNWGKPLLVEWDGEVREFVDGLGLCSCNRWRPDSRGNDLGTKAKILSSQLHALMFDFVVKQLGDVRQAGMKLALGKYQESPFSRESLDSVRKKWASLLEVPNSALMVAEGQPFMLDMMAQTLKVLEDPDWEILTSVPDSFSSGVPVGYKDPIPRTPDVFPERLKQSNLDDSIYQEISWNYKSAEEHSDGLEKKFREDEAAGMMYPSTLGALKSEFPGKPILVAALGAIAKPDGSVRPLHDGTHYVQVNNGIKFSDQLQYPGPHDVTALIREARDSGEAPFTLSADISAAHRRVKIRREDWHLLACKSSSASEVVWVNKVGTFGISSAPYYWTRLFGLVGRLVARILQQERVYQVIYVDDLHLVSTGLRKFLVLWIAIATYEVLGTPFAYHKFSGGLVCQFVGYELDYKSVAVGISGKRGQWLLEFLESFRRDNYTVYMRKFAEFLGRLSFVCRVLLWLRPHLAPLYSWSSALSKSTVATAPGLVKLTCRYLESQLSIREFLFSCKWPLVLKGDAFRTDAKCETGRIVFGGHCLLSGAWFSLEVDRSVAPFMFKENGESQWASTTAELVAVIFALKAFGYLEYGVERRHMSLSLQGGTDNKANESLSKKRSSTKWPLMLVSMQLSHLLMEAGLKVSLKWRPRDENEPADALTNGDFTGFDPLKRISIAWGDVDWSLLNSLWEERAEFLDRESWKTFGEGESTGRFEKSKWS